MVAWSPADPGAGDMDEIRKLKKHWSEASEKLAGIASSVGSTLSVVDTFWTGEGADTWTAGLTEEKKAADTAATSLASAAAAADTYANTVDSIKERAVPLKTKRDNAEKTLHPELDSIQFTEATRAQAQKDHTKAVADLAALGDERLTADAAFGSALEAATPDAWEGIGAAALKAKAFTTDAIKNFSPTDLLKALAGLSPHEAEKLLAEHPEITEKLDNADPAAINAWWNALSEDDKDHFKDTIPQVIGNLNGVPYGWRDLANRLYLENQIADAKKLVEEATKKGHGSQLVEPGLRIPIPNEELTAAQNQLNALEAIRKASKGSNPPRQVISLDSGQPPLTAIAVGNLDTADTVTYTIPGMGTYSSDMQLWTQGAQNLWAEQRRVDSGRSHVVVAWIGYYPPGDIPDTSVFRGERARIGADRFIHDAEGVRGTRGGDQPLISVVAHSYGTTLATDALAGADVDIDALVLLGSAGVENSIPNADALNADHVYSGTAKKDETAGQGQIFRHNPNDPGFGAVDLGVDGDDGRFGVTDHKPLMRSPWKESIDSKFWEQYPAGPEREKAFNEYKSQHGYLDRDTQSIHESAEATTRTGQRG